MEWFVLRLTKVRVFVTDAVSDEMNILFARRGAEMEG